MQQLDLFDPAPPAITRPEAPRPAPIAAQISALALRLPPNVLLGTSSWSFPGWAGLVYAGAETRQALSRRGLAAYAAHPLLRTVGIDSGFYAPLDPRRLAHGGAAPGLAVHPRLPPIPRQLELFGPSLTPDRPLIIRWLLRGNRGYGEARERYQPFDRLAEPDPGTRAQLVATLRGYGGRLIYLIANNKAEGSAPLTLIALARAWLDERPQRPMPR